MWHHHHYNERRGGPRGGGFRRGPFEFAWGFERGAGMRGGGGGGGGRRRMFDAGELRLVLLKLIAEQPRHGYDLIRAIEERSGGAYAPSPGVIYPTITMLDDMGLIDERTSEGARKTYAATEAGEAHLAERTEEVAALFARLEALSQSRSDDAPVRRAMHNLRVVLHHRLGDESGTPDLAHKIAEVLDEAARKIERL